MPTPSVPWVPTNEEVVRSIVRLIKPLPGDVFYDIGCGDGRVAIAIAKAYGIKTKCVEIRDDLIKQAMDKIKESRLNELVEVIKGDFFEINISDATIVYMYLLTSVNQKLKPKLERELRDGTIIVTLDFPIPDWKPLMVVELNRSWQRTLYVYVKGYSDKGVKEAAQQALLRISPRSL